jgi:putative DNA primase/helicase
VAGWEAADNNRLIGGATWYASQGWKILPCHGIVDGGRCTCGRPHSEPKDVGKHPAIDEWNIRATDDPQVIEDWWTQSPEANIGVFCRPSGFLVIDIDPRSGGIDSFQRFEELLEGNLPPTVEALTGEYTLGGKTVRGRHLFYRCDPSEALVGNLIKNGLKGIDIKHNGYVLIAPSRHFSGHCYNWVEGHAPYEMEMAEAPEELLSLLRKGRKNSSSSMSYGELDWKDVFGDLQYDGERVDIDKILVEGLEEGHRTVDIYKLSCALANKMGTDAINRSAAESLIIRFNHEKVRPPLPIEGPEGILFQFNRAFNFVEQNPITKKIAPHLAEWMKEKADEMSGVQTPDTQSEELTAMTGVVSPNPEIFKPMLGTPASSIAEALESGKSFEEATSFKIMDVPKDIDALTEADGGIVGMRSFTDTGNGRRIVDVFGQNIRYSEGLGWFKWDGIYWKPDIELLGMQEISKKLASIISSEVKYYENDTDKQVELIKFAQNSKSNARIDAAIKSSNSDPRILVPVGAWDKDEHYLGVANGVVDLRTGELLRGRPDLYITKRSPVSYTPGLTNTRWQQFIDYATGGDKELQEFIQRAAGYTITGSRKYDTMFLVYGPAGSGKNTLVEALVKALGTDQYAFPMDSTILAQNDGQSNSADLYHWAMLRGRRMVWVDELPESERLKENAVKKLTGSTEISARSPGERPFTFESKAKLWITTNHRPIITDEAMWRRIKPIPLIRPPEVSDPDLKEYIFDPNGALPAVLSWAVEGAIKILGSGAKDALGSCAAVNEASEIYRKNEDRIGLFLDEETKLVEGASVPLKEVYTIYKLWSEQRGEKAMSQIAFQRKLTDRNLDIVGHGARAVINGRILIPRAVESMDTDWQTAMRFAR